MNSSKEPKSAAAAAATRTPPLLALSSSPVCDSGGRDGSEGSASAVELFSAALQRVGNALGGTTATAGQSAPPLSSDSPQHRECDSDSFLSSDEDDNAERDEQDEEASSLSASSSPSSSSDGMWGTFTGGEAKLPLCDDDNNDTVSSSDGLEEGVLFVPDPIFDLASLQKKMAMPCLSQDQLPLGSTVWVVDEDDVATQLNCNFSASYPPVCNGRLSGKVVRHSGCMTLVCFCSKASDLCFTLSLPTSCLSLERIEPYDSVPHRGDSYEFGCGAYGMLGPRAVGRGRAGRSGCEKLVGQCLFEAMPAYDYERVRGTPLETAQDTFFSGAFEKALSSVNQCIDSQPVCQTEGVNAVRESGTKPASSSNAPLKAAALVDALILRSRILVFLERYSEALEDAQRCVELEPRWVRGYLSVARAYCGLGQFSKAVAATAHACIILPYSLELERIKELNNHMHYLQSQLGAETESCYLVLDCYYRKRLRVSTRVAAQTLLCTESTPILATHSVFVPREPPHRCPVCFRVLSTSEKLSNSAACPSSPAITMATASTPPTIPISPLLSSQKCAEMEDDVEYCSTECTQRATLYRPLELKHCAPLEHVRSLILSKGAVTLNVLPLEMAAMTVRLFLMVVTIHRRLSAKRRLEDSSRRNADSPASRLHRCEPHSWPELDVSACGALSNSQSPSPSPPVSLETSLRWLGVYPLCTEPIASNKLDELKIVYDALTADFKAEDRSTFSYEVLSQLYAYVSAYFTPVDLLSLEQPDSQGGAAGHETVFYLPHYVGCVEAAKVISYTAVSLHRRSGEDATGVKYDMLASRLREQPRTGEMSASSSARSSATHSDAKNLDTSTSENSDRATGSNNAANCVVQTAPRPALLKLVTVAPVNRERKLCRVPVTIPLDSKAP
ncbi:hypothetical protein JKF63_03027 [Porcisia hertigi]|uniref:Uncharacterized protein n=1 Tax=Porcisia hertigi TaxID=2761500 RepID=A0A836L570_9TRYP|nr:hypothetical protein JKF63_03027 [Porcisia hertigi]